MTAEPLAPAHAPLALEPDAAQTRRSSLAALYLLGALTCGLYLLYWMYAAVARDRSDRETSAHPVAAAIGSIAAPVQAALLFDLYRRSRARRGATTSAGACALPALLVLAIAIATALVPWLASLWIPGWLLAPLPVLVVQASFNRESASAPAARGGRVVAALSAVALAGAAATAAIFYQLDLPAARLLSHRSMESGELVLGSSALYTLRLDERGWRQAKPGTIGDADADLELISSDEQSWIVSYVHDAREVSLHDTVAARRTAIQGTGALEAFSEQRHFAPGAELFPVSIARYEVQSSGLIHETYLVYTASVDDRVVEIVGFTSISRGGAESIHALISSVELKRAGGQP